MVQAVIIHGSGGKVMAPIGGGEFIEGERRDVLITDVLSDDDLPLHVRQALVGLIMPTIFSSEQVGGSAPEGARVAYGSEVVEALKAVNKADIASDLCIALKELSGDDEHCFIFFRANEYKHEGKIANIVRCAMGRIAKGEYGEVAKDLIWSLNRKKNGGATLSRTLTEALEKEFKKS